jgi:hypothetical protein
MSTQMETEIYRSTHTAQDLVPDAALETNAWFLSFAQQTVDRMLHRYGISFSAATESETEHLYSLVTTVGEIPDDSSAMEMVA